MAFLLASEHYLWHSDWLQNITCGILIGCRTLFVAFWFALKHCFWHSDWLQNIIFGILIGSRTLFVTSDCLQNIICDFLIGFRTLPVAFWLAAEHYLWHSDWLQNIIWLQKLLGWLTARRTLSSISTTGSDAECPCLVSSFSASKVLHTLNLPVNAKVHCRADQLWKSSSYDDIYIGVGFLWMAVYIAVLSSPQVLL